MSNPNFQFDLPQLISALDAELEERMNSLSVSPEIYGKVLNYLTGDLQTLRFHLCNDALTVGETWRVIRSQEELVDLISDLTLSLHLYANVQVPDGWVKLSDLVANAIGSFNPPNVNKEWCALEDTSETELFATPTTVTHTIASNPWWVTLFLMRRTPCLFTHL